MQPPVEAFTDGACRGNPGPGGWAWAVLDGPSGSGHDPATIVPHYAPFALPVGPERWPSLWKHGQWNELRARIVGNPPKITTWINGVKIMEFTDNDRRHPDGDCRKRRVEVRGTLRFPRLVVEVQPRPRAGEIARLHLQRPHVVECAPAVVAERTGRRIAARERQRVEDRLGAA